jgi:class 3 adenylate cyclase
MASLDRKNEVRSLFPRLRVLGRGGGFVSRLIRYAGRQPMILAGSLLLAFSGGIGYRLLFDPIKERSFAYFLRSGFHGVGLALTVWTVQFAFATGAQSRLGAALRRLPLAVEVVVRALVMTGALIVVGLSLQALLYAEPEQLHWLTRHWLTVNLPSIVLIGFGLSLVIGTVVETQRLIGGSLLTSVLLGTYHRPSRQMLIVMFLDLGNSTRLAESMGELKVHDLITRFFFDIDEPISDFDGAVHAYVGDEVIVSWPLTGSSASNGRCVACFFAIERKMARLAPDYKRAFGVAPTFRAGLHAGPVIVSECGDAKRQLAFFGDTMNVAARLCEYCKTIDERLVVSQDLLRQMTVPAEMAVSEGKSIEVRGRRERVEVCVVREPDCLQ